MDYVIDLSNADTVVIVSTRRKYKLHSTTLAQCSEQLAMLLAEPGPTLINEGQKTGIRYLICLQNHDEATGAEIHPEFRRIPLDKNGHPAISFSQIFEHDPRNNIPASLFADYDRLLCTFCNRPIKLNDKSVAILQRDVMGLVKVAEDLGCVNVIAKTVESALLSEGQELFKAIAVLPVPWLDLAHRIRSKSIFKESLIHLAGRYNALVAVDSNNRSALDDLSPELRALVEKKNAELKSKCAQVELTIWSHYPGGLMKTAVTFEAKRDKIGRSDYQKDVFTWIALSLYRHWFGVATTQCGGRFSRSGGHEHYAKLYAGGTAYLTRDVQEAFHVHFPMTNKGKSVLEGNIDIIKVGVQELVAPLFKNESQLDTSATPVKWLVCSEVKAEDYIWEQDIEGEEIEEAEEAQEADDAYMDEDDSDADADVAEEVETHGSIGS